MAAITNVDGDIQTQTSTLSSAISTARKAVIDDITTSEGAHNTDNKHRLQLRQVPLSSRISQQRKKL